MGGIMSLQRLAMEQAGNHPELRAKVMMAVPKSALIPKF
jgi:hypothetical protein